ncbi:Adenylate cyclase 2 [Mycobacterium innocens]|uniref:Adenylate cyclase 2 n=1 Tax=Mycobacterium innocens TaxID=2341083 RepID=A0A498QHW2_9MYCO|nr:Adenylate cyclase 2 [Mycobacterium innocens]
MTLVVALLLLAVVLGFAVARPRGWPEPLAAVPVAVILIGIGAISLQQAAAQVAGLARVVAFLGAVLVLAKLCDDEGLFEAAGAAMARTSTGSAGLLRHVFVIAAVITAVLSLDATVVLLTPVVLAVVRRLRPPVRPYAYATAHLANAASLLLPVSNLTNLLAYHVAGISFIKFTLVMGLPWLAAVAAVYAMFRWFFARDLRVAPDPEQLGPPPRPPVFVLVVVALTLAGFVIAEAAGVAPAWAALAGASLHLAGAGAAQLPEQRVGQPRHQPGVGAFDAHQAHLLGGGQVTPGHQVAQHINGQRFALRQRVDHPRKPRSELTQLARHGVGQARRDRDVALPHPHPGQFPHLPGHHLIGQQLPKEQGVSASQLSEPSRATRVDRTAQRVFDHLTSCRSRKGTVDKFTGDGIMAVFGAPVALEDHALRACLAALGIQEEIIRLAAEVHRRDGVDLLLRVGLNSGQLIAGEIGAAALGYTAIGEQVGMAQRMESVAPPGGVMLSDSTARLVEGAAVLGDPQLARIKGAADAVPARRLLSVAVQRTGVSHSTLVGRDWELATLAAMFDRSMAGRGSVVTVVGPPGIGKTRLIAEAVQLAKQLGVEVFRPSVSRMPPTCRSIVVARRLRSVGQANGLDDQTARTQVRTRFPDADPQDLLLLDDLLGVADSEAELPRIDPDARRRRLTALINTAQLARSQPAVFVVEDAHWIDEVSESMLADFLAVTPPDSLAGADHPTDPNVTEPWPISPARRPLRWHR